MSIVDIKTSEIEEFCASNERCARVVDQKFDIEKAMDIIKNFPYQPESKDRQGKYKAISTQYSEKDGADIYYGAVESIRYINSKHESVIETDAFHGWKYRNELGEQLLFLEGGQELYRTRVLLAMAHGYKSPWHIDYDWRYHVPLTTNTKCLMHYEDMSIHLPATGHAYLFNAGYMHSFVNEGETDRYHYCGILDYPCEGDGKINVALPLHE